MSEMMGGAATGGQVGPGDAAAGGTPDESDLPRLQGLDDSVDDPSDPTAAGPEETDRTTFGSAMGSGDSKGGSDPMPDMSGTSGS